MNFLKSIWYVLVGERRAERRLRTELYKQAIANLERQSEVRITVEGRAEDIKKFLEAQTEVRSQDFEVHLN